MAKTNNIKNLEIINNIFLGVGLLGFVPTVIYFFQDPKMFLGVAAVVVFLILILINSLIKVFIEYVSK